MVNKIEKYEIPIKFVQSFVDLQNRIKKWSDAFINGDFVAVDVASKTAHWYYSPVYDTFGPSKFIGYENISLSEYNPSELDGRDTENAISQLNEYSLLKEDHPDAQKYRQKLANFLDQQNKKEKSNAQIHISEKFELRKLMFQLHIAREIFSYKYVMLLALLQNFKDSSKTTQEYFWEYYRNRKYKNLPPDKDDSAISKVDLENYNRSQINNILEAPFEAINNCAVNYPIIIKKDADYHFSQRIINELPDHKQELIDFIDFKLNQYFEENIAKAPSAWWVNQGKTYAVEKSEALIWAPQHNRNGASFFHWENVKKVKKGDIVFNYANGTIRDVSIALKDGYEGVIPESFTRKDWEDNGYRADINYEKLANPIPIEKIGTPLAALRMDYGPINKSGGVNQGYLYSLNREAVGIIATEINLDSISSEVKQQIERLIDKKEIDMTALEIIDHVYGRMKAQGFVISKADLVNFYCCLRAKPFVILAGISGTGKTKFVRLFAEAVGATEENHRFQLIPVRPDWNDNSELLGFFDLNNRYQPGSLISLFIRAHVNPDKPHFLCLDEMNLARVEHYFSDFLSIIESRRFDGEKVSTDQMLSREQMLKLNKSTLDEQVKSMLEDLMNRSPHGLGLPENLYVIGTVNMDETTHPFSRKVLDRANTIEFSDIHLKKGLTLRQGQEKDKELNLNNDTFRARFLTMRDLLMVDEGIPSDVSERLHKLNNILSKAKCQVGYRVRDEAAFYMKNVIEIGDDSLDLEAGFERVVLQKILPRLQGSSYQIRAVLEGLLKQYSPENIDITFDDEEYTNKMQELIENQGPLVKKIGNMLIQFMEDGFTSFWAN